MFGQSVPLVSLFVDIHLAQIHRLIGSHHFESIDRTEVPEHGQSVHRPTSCHLCSWRVEVVGNGPEGEKVAKFYSPHFHVKK